MVSEWGKIKRRENGSQEPDRDSNCVARGCGKGISAKVTDMRFFCKVDAIYEFSLLRVEIFSTKGVCLQKLRARLW
jgi:hypothetical protein